MSTDDVGDRPRRQQKRRAGEESPGVAARPKRDIKRRPVYVPEPLVLGRPMGPVKKNTKPNKPSSAKPRPHRGGTPQQTVERLSSEPLLRAAQSAAEWGWKNSVEPGTELCLLYYGCPERPEYYCCERHRQLWQAGRLHVAWMPEEWKVGAPDPLWVDDGRDTEAGGPPASATSSKSFPSREGVGGSNRQVRGRTGVLRRRRRGASVGASVGAGGGALGARVRGM